MRTTGPLNLIYNIAIGIACCFWHRVIIPLLAIPVILW
jgi:hypothetical protein